MRKLTSGMCALVFVLAGASGIPSAAAQVDKSRDVPLTGSGVTNLGYCDSAPALAQRAGGWVCSPRLQDPEAVRAAVEGQQDIEGRSDSGGLARGGPVPTIDDGYCSANPCQEYSAYRETFSATVFYGINSDQIGIIFEYGRVELYNYGFKFAQDYLRVDQGPPVKGSIGISLYRNGVLYAGEERADSSTYTSSTFGIPNQKAPFTFYATGGQYGRYYIRWGFSWYAQGYRNPSSSNGKWGNSFNSRTVTCEPARTPPCYFPGPYA